MPSRKGQSKKTKGAATPRARRTRSTVREAHYRSPQSDPAASPHHHSAMSAHDWYRQEKARRAGRPSSPAEDLIEQARREFRALLAAEAAAGKGGRPRKNAPAAARPRRAPGADLDPDDAPGAPDDADTAPDDDA